jgi:hypothetical protein
MCSWAEIVSNAYPLISSFLMIVGFLRIINKPLFAMLQSIVKVTPWESDNKILEAVERSRLYAIFCFLVDWLGSVKLPKK